jgi:glycosyltransferase involved in cell wall biosynthesis
MKILYHHRTQGEEPESIHIGAVVEALRGLGHEVHIVGPAPIAHGKQAAQRTRSALVAVKEAVPRAVFELLQVAYNLVALLRLGRAVSAVKPDFIYERYALFAFAGVLLAKWRGVPLILEVNTPYAQAWATYFGLHLQRLGRWIERRTLLAADHVITVTHVQRAMLEAIGIPAARITVSHNAIDPDWFCADKHLDPTLRHALGLGEVVVGFVGTMNRWQGIPAFQGVIRAVLEQCPQASFLFVGDGEFRPVLEAACRADGHAGRVVFTGRQAHADVPRYVAAMDIAVLLNSNSYGSPMKIFEYWGMGKAVVAPSVAPVLEVLQDGRTGLLIEPGNVQQMTDRILRLVRDRELRERLGRGGREYVTAHHTWRDNAAQVIEAYARIAASSGLATVTP